MIVNPCDPELLYAVLQVCFMFTTLMLFYNFLVQVFYLPYPQNPCDAAGDATQLLGYKAMEFNTMQPLELPQVCPQP
jgi:hypothetical protein